MTVTSILYPQDRSFSLSWYPLFVLVLKEVSVSFSAYTFLSGAPVWCYATLWSMRTPGVEYFLALESLFFHRVVAFMSLSQLVTQISGLPCLMTCRNYGTRGVWRDKWDVHLQLQLWLFPVVCSAAVFCVVTQRSSFSWCCCFISKGKNSTESIFSDFRSEKNTTSHSIGGPRRTKSPVTKRKNNFTEI